VLAFYCQKYGFHLIYGISLSFSSIFLLLILRNFGFLPGIISAFVVHVASYFILDVSLFGFIGLIEIIFLGIVINNSSRSLLLWDAVFWIVIGLPYTILIYNGPVSAVPLELVVMILIVSSNGLFNALFVDLLMSYIPIQCWLGFTKDTERTISFKQVLFHFSITAVLLPFFLYIVMNSWYFDENMTRNSLQLAVNTSNSIEKELKQWSPEDVQRVMLKDSLYLAYLQDLVEKYTSEGLFNLIITDKQNLILAGNESVFKTDQTYDWQSNNIVEPVMEQFYRVLPQLETDLLPTQKWSEGVYLYTTTLQLRGPSPDRTMVNLNINISVPIKSYQEDLFRQYLGQFRYLLFFAICALAFAVLINRAMVKSLSKLADTTTGLPSKLKLMENIEWPNSRIYEIKSLIINFRHMSQDLLKMFNDSMTMNQQLKEKTDKLLKSEQKLHQLAYYDMLTGLPNRLHFTMHIQQLLSKADINDRPVALMFADLNRFKQINDTLGHAAGDELLKVVANRFSKVASEKCTVFRLGGDEFVIVMELEESQIEINPIVQKIVADSSESVTILGNTLYTTVSLGISIYPYDGLDMDTIVKNADMAMYHAKEQGGSNVQFFHEKLDFTEKMLLDHGLREALTNEQFCLNYQLKVDTDTGEICGFEALIRWNHPSLGRVAPDRFISLAEDSGMIIEIDEWVLREACRQNKAWQDQGLPKLPVAINISARHFSQTKILELLKDALETSGLEANYLILEITEGVFIKELDQVIETLTKIRELGIKISIDDFGTGYSSLNQLQRLPIYDVKLDRSFIQDISQNKKKAFVVKAIVELAHSMDLRVIAEGIENVDELRYFSQLKCDELQGYYFSKPLPPDEFERILLVGHNGLLDLKQMD
jgi:diguanylate cyclase (GGDEF)-like protein